MLLPQKAVTSDDELLAVHARVSFGALQQGDPVVHLLGRVGVAVQHAVCRDHDEGVGPETRTREGRGSNRGYTHSILIVYSYYVILMSYCVILCHTYVILCHTYVILCHSMTFYKQDLTVRRLNE